MQPCYTHPSGLQVYAVDQGGKEFRYTYYDVGPDEPVPVVIFHPTGLGPVIFHLANTSQQRAAAYVVATTASYRHWVNVGNYGSDTAQPPFERELHLEPDVIWIEPGNTYALTGMTGKFAGYPSFPFLLHPMLFDRLWAFKGPLSLSYSWMEWRFYPGLNSPTRQAYDLCIGFKSPE